MINNWFPTRLSVIFGKLTRIKRQINLTIRAGALPAKKDSISEIDAILCELGAMTLSMPKDPSFEAFRNDADTMKAAAWSMIDFIESIEPDQVASGKQELLKTQIYHPKRVQTCLKSS